jgi:hypothetical protein
MDARPFKTFGPVSPNLTGSLFKADGTPAILVEMNGDVVVYADWVHGTDHVGTLNVDVFYFGQLKTLNAQIRALNHDFRAPNSEPLVGITTASQGVICIFRDQLCYRFVKQGGYRAHYAPVTRDEAEGLITGEKCLKYVKSSNRFNIQQAA